MSKNQKYSFEEVKMMVASAEKVTERRLSNNKTNYSITLISIWQIYLSSDLVVIMN